MFAIKMLTMCLLKVKKCIILPFEKFVEAYKVSLRKIFYKEKIQIYIVFFTVFNVFTS